MAELWTDETPGPVVLPSGRRVRGRGLRSPAEGQLPTFALELTGQPGPEPSWKRVWVRWPDFWVPSDLDAALAALTRAHQLASSERVEITCGGGIGRTGTGLAALCVLEGMDPAPRLRGCARTTIPARSRSAGNDGSCICRSPARRRVTSHHSGRCHAVRR